MPSKGEKYYFISSLGKGLRILELLGSHDELTISNLASRLNTNRAGVHRFLFTLRDLGYVEKTDQGRYRLTFKVLEMGMNKLAGFEIRHIAHPMMQELASIFGETVNLGYWDNGGIVHLDKIDSPEILRMDCGLGTVAPAYCTGLGKAILAFLPEEEVDIYLQDVELLPLTPKTIVSPEAMRAELDNIRRAGVAVDREELSLGLCCVAAPVFDYSGRARYAISTSGPTHRISNSRLDQMAAKVKAICEVLSERIGAPGRKPETAGG